MNLLQRILRLPFIASSSAFQLLINNGLLRLGLLGVVKKRKQAQGFKYLQVWVKKNSFDKLKTALLSEDNFMEDFLIIYDFHSMYDGKIFFGIDESIALSEVIVQTYPNYSEIARIHAKFAWILILRL